MFHHFVELALKGLIQDLDYVSLGQVATMKWNDQWPVLNEMIQKFLPTKCFLGNLVDVMKNYREEIKKIARNCSQNVWGSVFL